MPKHDKRSAATDGTDLPPVDDEVLDALGAALFAALPRSDQRQRGMAYLHGLLETPGRKSIRNIALLGGRATEQNLHHFICGSTWDWRPVRRALATEVVRATPPAAWVLRPLVIPKAGEHSVGVGRRFCPALGQVVNGQQAVGVWAASPGELPVPVDWRLQLDGEGLAPCVTGTFLEAAVESGLPPRPVVLDARGLDLPLVLARLRAGRPGGSGVLLRVDGSLPLEPIDGRSVLGPGPWTARQLMAVSAGLRRPVALPGRQWVTRPPAARRPVAVTGVVASTPVRLGAEGPYRLMGVARIDERWPGQLWLTDLLDACPQELVELAALPRRVDRAAAAADGIGLRDFAGRSFSGWHRHVTLVSAAHAAVALSAGRNAEPADQARRPVA